MAEGKDPHESPAGETGVPQISAPPPVAPSHSDFDAHHWNRYERRSQVITSSSNNDDDYWREAVELDEVRSPRPSSISTASISSGECRASHSFRVITQASAIRPDDGPFRNRDHFALERTYLAYIRTSMAFAFLGVIIAQLFRLQMKSDSGPALGFDDLGIPLACGCYGAAILIALMGSYRFWRQQSAMARGKVYAGGWELNSMGMLGIGVTVVILALIAAVDPKTG
ncbi:hypothetical protein FQN54_003460 [Arachnomyces sp. PD_36]|nr:hypothetical protein FQN54_003460 [Arachnomyces sp. PD_36]